MVEGERGVVEVKIEGKSSRGVLARSPTPLVACSACGHLPCPHCVTICDQTVEVPEDPAKVAYRQTRVQLGSGLSEATTERARERRVRCGECRKSLPVALAYARVPEGFSMTWYCSEACVEAWVHQRERELCPCTEADHCTWSPEDAAKNAATMSWFEATTKELGLVTGSSGVDDDGHVLIYAPEEPDPEAHLKAVDRDEAAAGDEDDDAPSMDRPTIEQTIERLRLAQLPQVPNALARRATTDAQKEEVVAALLRAWKAKPLQRLGQLLVNVCEPGLIYYAEDLDVAARLEEVAARGPKEKLRDRIDGSES